MSRKTSLEKHNKKYNILLSQYSNYDKNFLEKQTLALAEYLLLLYMTLRKLWHLTT